MSKSVVLRLLPSTGTDVANGDWIIGPVGQTRDSDLVEQANFTYLVQEMSRLDPDGRDHEVLGWDHWACGWIEEMAVRPGTRCQELQEELVVRLEGYPVLSEDILSTLEMEQGMMDGDDGDPPEVEDIDLPEMECEA